MALTAAEKQKAYRARKLPKAPDATSSQIVDAAGPMDTAALLVLVEGLYERRASNTTWRLELRRALLGGS